MLDKLLNRLRQMGKITNVKIETTKIEHDATGCTEDCAICKRVEETFKRMWKEMGIDR